MTDNNSQVRVMLWSPPKSLSTVFQKMMSYVDDCQIINEPFQSASRNNREILKAMPETTLLDIIDSFESAASEVQDLGNLQDVGWDDTQCTPAWVKNLLEEQFPGKNVIFSKDLIHGIRDQFHMIPKGYRHTFLIRNPIKVMTSLRNAWYTWAPVQELNLLDMPPGITEFHSPLADLIEYVKENEGETNPIIIDADDLQNHPESIVPKYCNAVGIPYKESLLTWPAGDSCVKNNWLVSRIMLQGNVLAGYYAAAFASTKFIPSTPVPPDNELPSDVVEAAKSEGAAYKRLYDMRLKP